ncbi:MAG: peptidoglycan DD-metalloendopeptidase family protein [Bacteroidaceae bacterium]
MIISTIKAGLIGIMALVSLPSVGQDLMARQAPIDRKMKIVDSLNLERLIRTEQNQNFSTIYPTWDNKYAHKYGVEMPDSFRIDLKRFCMPTTNRRITSNFGYRPAYHREHKGLDIKVYIGDTIRSAFSGKVRIVKYEARGYGNYVIIRHSNGLETVYGHLSKHLVAENQDVKVGEPIGLGGNTGRSTGSHLHFETRLLGEAINPALLFDFPNQDVTNDFYTYRRSTYSRESLMASAKRSGLNSSLDDGKDTEENDIADAKATRKMQDFQQSSAVRFHKVTRGETLYAIAGKYNTSIDKLCSINGLKKNTKLRPGQILRYM